MESRLEACEGQTFSSSYRGLHFTQLNRYMALLSVLIFVLLTNIIGQHEVDRADSLFFAVGLFLVFYFFRGRTTREVFRSSVTVVAGGLEVEDGDDVAQIPWPEILYIRIDRSASGHRRKFYIRARGGRLFTLLDPEQGEQFEAWAVEVAQPAGVKVRILSRFYLNGEPLWTFLSCCLLLVVLHATSFFGLF
jgi:hypothetical protein